VERSRLSGAAVNNIVTEITLLKLLKNEYIVQMKDFQWNERFVLHAGLQMKYANTTPALVLHSVTWFLDLHHHPIF
jgi:ATP-dependent 26S proteasome regulatory subunit